MVSFSPRCTAHNLSHADTARSCDYGDADFWLQRHPLHPASPVNAAENHNVLTKRVASVAPHLILCIGRGCHNGDFQIEQHDRHPDQAQGLPGKLTVTGSLRANAKISSNVIPST